MKELTLIQKFDAVLTALYDISGNSPTFGRISALLRARKQKVHWGEVWDILRKMERDNLIHPPSIDVVRVKGKNSFVLYLITFEGKLMKETKGLRGKLKRDRQLKKRVATLEVATFLIAIATLYYASRSVEDSTVKELNGTLKTIQQQKKEDSHKTPQFAPDTNNHQRSIRPIW